MASVCFALLLALIAELTISFLEHRIRDPLVTDSLSGLISGSDGVQVIEGSQLLFMYPHAEIRLDLRARHVDMLMLRVSPGASKLAVYAISEVTGEERRVEATSWLLDANDSRPERLVWQVGEKVRTMRIVSEKPGGAVQQLEFKAAGPVREARWATLSASSLLLLSMLLAGRHGSGRVASVALLMVLSSGGLMVMTAPYSHVGWDEHVHYQRVDRLLQSWGPVRERFDAFASSYTPSWSRSYEEQESINEQYSRRTRSEEQTSGPPIALAIGAGPTARFFEMYVQMAYLPNVLGAQLARSMDAPVHVGYKMGRLSGLLWYALVVWLAVRVAPAGKWMIAAVALMPLSVFAATTHTYDAWMIGWILLGFAGLLRFVSSSGDDHVSAWLMLFAIFVGIAPKPIYFPLLLIPVLLVLWHGSGRPFRIRFCMAGLVMAVFAVASFALPILFDGAGQGDPRGGSEVNPGGQMAFVLAHPVHFIHTLIQAAGHFLSPTHLPLLLNAYGVLGVGVGTEILVFVLFLLTFTDPRLSLGWQDRLAVLGAVTTCLVLIMAALYVAFNPVGASVIDGLQPRYLLVLLAPIMVAVAVNRPGSGVLQDRTRGLLLASIPAIGIWNWWDAIASKLY